MAGILLPICATFFSLLLTIIYFSKKRIDLVENKIYSFMIPIVLIDSVLVSLVQGIGLNGINSISNIFISLINKIDFMLLVVYSNCILFYIILITYPKVKNKFKFLLSAFSVLDILVFIFIALGKVIIISKGHNNSVEGSSLMTTLIVCGIYIFSSIVISIINIKKIDKRYIPVFASIGIALFLIPMFKINPYLIVVSITLTFINYIMFFTIENPDVKMVKELEIAKDAAVKANKAKSEFLSSMSHELRTPLNAIVCFSELLETKEGLDKESKDFAKDIVNASHNLLELVNGVLDISKIEAGKMEVINKEYNAKELFNSLSTMVIPRIGDKKIEFKTRLAEDLPCVLNGDTGKIKQIILNLLTNAVKYTEKGYVKLKVNSSLEENKCNLEIIIEDTGKGIKEENKDLIFDKFGRETKDTDKLGLGLGLTITKSLVEMLNGKIEFTSEEGKGTTFAVNIKQDLEEVNKVDLSEKKVLILHTSNILKTYIRKILEKYEIKVYEASKCSEALEFLEDNKCDVVLTDILIEKEMSVKEFALISKFEKELNIKIITIGRVENTTDHDYEGYAFDGYVSENLNENEIINKIKEVLK